MPVTPLDPGTAYFTVAELREFAGKPLDDAIAYPDATVEAARNGAQEDLEHECRVAFVPRTETETINGAGLTVVLRRPKVTAVASVTVDGAALTAEALGEVKITPGGGLYRVAGWASGVANVEVTYTHGFAVPPPRIKLAAMILTKDRLIDSPFGDRVLRIETDTQAFSRSWRGFGLPEVDEAVKAHDHTLPIG